MKAFKNTRYKDIFQSLLQTKLSSKIRLSIIQYFMMFDNAMCLNVTLQLQDSNANVTTLKKLFLSCFAFHKVPKYLFIDRDYCICVIISVCVLCFNST